VASEIGRDITYQPGDAVHVGDAPADIPQRQLVLRLLANLPTFADAVRKLSAGEVFRVVMSKENAYLFKQGADGAWKPYLRKGKHFVENVDLIKVSPDYIGAISNVALMVNMAAIAAKLETIEVGVRNIARLMADTQRGRVKGALDALALSRALADPAERRTQMISASRDVAIELRALTTGQLRAHIAAMPEKQTGVFEGFRGNGLAAAKAAYEQVEDDVGLLIDGVRELLRTYQYLDEPAVATEAIDRILDGVKQAGLTDAIRKARLVPIQGAVVAELHLGSFFDAVTVMDTNLCRLNEPDRPLIVMDFKPEELLN
jgi:phosphoglycolate phosphatase-like HAD superfamily hydrolase